MKVATFKATCSTSTCLSVADVPWLSDFSYGEFLYGSVDGKEIRYYNALDCPTWKFVDEMIGELFNDHKRKRQGVTIQKIIGLIADREDPDVFYTPDIYCPVCHSKIQAIDLNQRTGLQEYRDLTFQKFESMDPTEKRNTIGQLIKSIL
ncbi:MAG TPA: hypothetical protein PKH79_08345 [Prolixibacteraceae bacterium]|nr:hypothetical protein [Prolixibacteraceae bacterium]HPS12176.1 hypothetical protein [Prolixibacteraceae bacterium]